MHALCTVTLPGLCTSCICRTIKTKKSREIFRCEGLFEVWAATGLFLTPYCRSSIFYSYIFFQVHEFEVKLILAAKEKIIYILSGQHTNTVQNTIKFAFLRKPKSQSCFDGTTLSPLPNVFQCHFLTDPPMASLWQMYKQWSDTAPVLFLSW